MKRLLIGIIGVTMLFGPASWVSGADNPGVGSWKINLAKSTYNPASLAPKSTTLKTDAAGDAFKTAVDVVDSTGKSLHYEYTYKLDGKDVRVTGDPNRDMTSVKKIDDVTYEQVNKRGGKVMTTSRVVYAKDFKSRTITTKGTNPAGQAVNNVVVWDRQ
ncbi:MAG TPA: hypothetical protein VFB85_26525 [Vicinamibacterales bacterium]|nr:hypothetical protein [Vicinamibacterales bacterium]